MPTLTYRCTDCGETCGGDQIGPLQMPIGSVTYRKDDPLLRNYAWPYPEDSKTFPGYILQKCPYCRGKLLDTDGHEPPVLPFP